jgi:hypothetical protein
MGKKKGGAAPRESENGLTSILMCCYIMGKRGDGEVSNDLMITWKG